MTDNLLSDGPPHGDGGDAGVPADAPNRDAPNRETPEGDASEGGAPSGTLADAVPEKFLDPETGEVRVEALAKSYRELERRLGAVARAPGPDADAAEVAAWRRTAGVPETADDYRIDLKEGLLDADPDVNKRLHEANFSQAQAQVVYDLAEEKLLPVVEAMALEFEAQRQSERLERHFGGAAKWQEVRDAVRRWGESHLPAAAFEALATTYEGVVALHRMMESGEPALVRQAEGGAGLSESKLREMMADPRYWRDRDPAWVRRVSEGFRALYPEKG